MKQMSFALTTPQFRARSKRVTRRVGWLTAKAGERVIGIEKGQGLKKGEHPVKLGEIELENVRREPLRAMTDDPAYGAREVVLEGFPEMTPAQFVQMFCKTHRGCTPDTLITRLAFDYR